MNTESRLASLSPVNVLLGFLFNRAFLPQIVPIENIQGRKAVEGGDLCLRKTTNGVDLNRNWGYAWAQVSARAQKGVTVISLQGRQTHSPKPTPHRLWLRNKQ